MAGDHHQGFRERARKIVPSLLCEAIWILSKLGAQNRHADITGAALAFKFHGAVSLKMAKIRAKI